VRIKSFLSCLQVHFPPLAQGAALRTFATYITQRTIPEVFPVLSPGGVTPQTASGSAVPPAHNQNQRVPARSGHRDLTNPLAPFAALVRDTSIGREALFTNNVTRTINLGDDQEHSECIGAALSFFGFEKMVRIDSRVLGTERPRGGRRRSSENEPALGRLLGVDQTSRQPSRRTSDADS
jgi:hypothetical protein